MNSIAQTNQSEKQLSEKMQSFLSRYHVGRLLRSANAYKNIRCVMRGRYRSSWSFSCPSCCRYCHKSCENVHNKGVFPVTNLWFSMLDKCF